MSYSFADFLADVDAELSTLIDKTSADFPEYNFESDFESKFPVSLSAQEAILSAVPTTLKPMIIIPNPNDPQFRFKLLQACSNNFLTSQLPDNWLDLTELEQDTFLCDYAWQPLEYFSPKQLWQAIDNSADTIYAFFSTFNLSVDNSSIPHNL